MADLTLDDEIERTLLENRRLFFATQVDSETAADAVRKLWYLELKAPGEPITMVINSPGGEISSGFAIWDQARMISSPITTLVTGLAASMGSILMQCAAPERRLITPNARVMIHQPAIHGAVRGQASDLEIHAREILKTRDRIVDLYVEKTGKEKAAIKAAIERDTWMDAPEAKEFGLVDRVVEKFSDLS